MSSCVSWKELLQLLTCQLSFAAAALATDQILYLYRKVEKNKIKQTSTYHPNVERQGRTPGRRAHGFRVPELLAGHIWRPGVNFHLNDMLLLRSDNFRLNENQGD